MKKNCEMRILGTEYKVLIDTGLCRSKDGVEVDGLCDVYKKVIYIRDPADMLEASDDRPSKLKRFREVLRHEIVHAFFRESGLMEYCDDEKLVDWIAINFQKMDCVFDGIGAKDCSPEEG